MAYNVRCKDEKYKISKGDKTMLDKIEGRYWVRKQMMDFIETAEGMIKKYGWQNMTIAPYNHAEPIMKVVAWLKDYDRCTAGSKETLVLIANGMADVLNAWEKHEADKTIKVRLLTGKHKGEERMISPEDLEMFEGLVEVL